MTGFDAAVFLENLEWLKPELLLTVAGFVVLGLAVASRKATRRPARGSHRAASRVKKEKRARAPNKAIERATP